MPEQPLRPQHIILSKGKDKVFFLPPQKYMQLLCIPKLFAHGQSTIPWIYTGIGITFSSLNKCTRASCCYYLGNLLVQFMDSIWNFKLCICKAFISPIANWGTMHIEFRQQKMDENGTVCLSFNTRPTW